MEADMDQWNIEKIKQCLSTLYEDRDPGHDFAHIERLLILCFRLIDDTVEIDRDFLQFLCLCHGLWKKEKAESAKYILLEEGLSSSYVEQVFRSVYNVADGRLDRIEEKIVFDANRLERVGATGIFRTCVIGGCQGQEWNTTIGYLQKNIDTTVCVTDKGKAIAEERVRFSKQFLSLLRRELGQNSCSKLS